MSHVNKNNGSNKRPNPDQARKLAKDFLAKKMDKTGSLEDPFGDYLDSSDARRVSPEFIKNVDLKVSKFPTEEYYDLPETEFSGEHNFSRFLSLFAHHELNDIIMDPADRTKVMADPAARTNYLEILKERDEWTPLFQNKIVTVKNPVSKFVTFISELENFADGANPPNAQSFKDAVQILQQVLRHRQKISADAAGEARRSEDLESQIHKKRLREVIGDMGQNLPDTLDTEQRDKLTSIFHDIDRLLPNYIPYFLRNDNNNPDLQYYHNGPRTLKYHNLFYDTQLGRTDENPEIKNLAQKALDILIPAIEQMPISEKDYQQQANDCNSMAQGHEDIVPDLSHSISEIQKIAKALGKNITPTQIGG